MRGGERGGVSGEHRRLRDHHAPRVPGLLPHHPLYQLLRPASPLPAFPCLLRLLLHLRLPGLVGVPPLRSGW